MKYILKLKLAANSLFIRVFLCFMIIITLLISSNFLSITFFQNYIQQETITYNTNNVNNTVKNYEEQLEGIVDQSLVFSIDELLNTMYYQTLMGDDFSYLIADKIIKRNKNLLLSSDFQYVDDLLITFDNQDVVINKDGIYSLQSMYTKYLKNPNYPYVFWKDQFQESFDKKILPATTFTYYSGNNKQLIPIIVKHPLFSEMYVTAFLDADKIFYSAHQSINYKLVILDNNDDVLFSTTNQNIAQLPIHKNTEGHVKINDQYYFYKKGSFSNLTYINIIPTEYIDANIYRMNTMVVLFLIISIILAIITSFWFSKRFNNPIKKILQSIQQVNAFEPFKTNINEYREINKNLNTLMQEHQTINRNLKQKNNFLKSYVYINKIKNLDGNNNGIKDFNFTDEPYKFLMFNIFLKNRFKELALEGKAANRFLRDYLSHTTSDFSPEAVTFQADRYQILSLIFLNGKSEKELANFVTSMKDAFNVDHDYYYVTITVSATHNHASQLTNVYEKVLHASQQRKLDDKSQIIYDIDVNSEEFFLTPNQEQEFHIHLLEGNDAVVITWVERLMRQMCKKGISATHIREYAYYIVSKINQTLLSLNLDNGPLQTYSEQLEFCHTLMEYDEFFENYLLTATALIKKRKEEHDSITSFVFTYINEHYAEDISLDILADQLKISTGYLSTYFKEKTGKNFIDYLNEQRIANAKTLLSDTNLKVQEIGEKVGYLNASSFYRMFKRITGVTPGDYRKKNVS
ncbi:helix-turn-helix domain-containing protein [Radiobacillus sp. PE A8.2]|uniref:helix-turn-helix domain-containing protein n=1 Tax=Radiobacillus sp. PE A8.2 TaxID=3380349 RepID=UPI00388DA967